MMNLENCLLVSEKFRHVPKEIRYAVTGSGPALFGFEEREGLFNFAMAPQELQMTYGILQRYKEHLAEGCRVLITILPFVFGRNNDLQREDYYDRYYFFLEEELIPGFDMEKKRLADEALAQVKRLQVDEKSLFSFDPSQRTASMESLMHIWREEFCLIDFDNASQAEKHGNTMREKQGHLRSIIKLCRENELKPIIVIQPLAGYIKRNVSKEFIDAFMFANIREAAGDVPLLDYYSMSDFDDDLLYHNGIFMNETGRKLFSERVFADIDQL